MSPTSGLIGEAWQMYKAHWRHLLMISATVYLAVSILGLVLSFIFEDWIAGVIGALISLIAVFWLQAALVKAVEDIRDGQADLTLGSTFAAAREHLVPVTLAGLLFGLAVGLGLIVVAILGGILGGAGVAIGIIGLIAWFLLLLVWWCVVTPAIVLENKGVGDGLARSRDLVRGHGWGVLGVIVVAVLLLIGVAIVLSVILSPLDERVQNFVSQIVSGTVTAPFFAVVLTLLYFRLRAVKEPVAEMPASATPAP